MARRKTKDSPEEDFPMTPMIDMVFLLLVFFMTVSTLAQADKLLELELPESDESKVPDDLAHRGTVSIDAEGNAYIGTRSYSVAEVKEQIKAQLENDPKLQIHVRADRAAPYSAIKKVLRTCAEAGAYDVIYATLQSN